MQFYKRDWLLVQGKDMDWKEATVLVLDKEDGAVECSAGARHCSRHRQKLPSSVLCLPTGTGNSWTLDLKEA